MTEITETIRDKSHLRQRLIALSLKHGGAWTFSVLPFSHTTTFVRAANPSSLPDQYIDLSHNTVAWRGQLRGFSPAATIREQNRGIGRG